MDVDCCVSCLYFDSVVKILINWVVWTLNYIHLVHQGKVWTALSLDSTLQSINSCLLSNSRILIKFSKFWRSDWHVQVLRSCWGAVEQVRSYYVDWRMLRDVKRRQMAFEYADERLRINSLRKNTILPKELQVQCGSLL